MDHMRYKMGPDVTAVHSRAIRDLVDTLGVSCTIYAHGSSWRTLRRAPENSDS